jgi:hypothetical protein
MNKRRYMKERTRSKNIHFIADRAFTRSCLWALELLHSLSIDMMSELSVSRNGYKRKRMIRLPGKTATPTPLFRNRESYARIQRSTLRKRTDTTGAWGRWAGWWRVRSRGCYSRRRCGSSRRRGHGGGVAGPGRGVDVAALLGSEGA